MRPTSLSGRFLIGELQDGAAHDYLMVVNKDLRGSLLRVDR